MSQPDFIKAYYAAPSEEAPGETAIAEIVAVPMADKPEIFNAPHLTLAPDVAEQLVANGFDESRANGLAIVFHDENAQNSAGFQNDDDYLAKGADGTFVQYPLSVYVRTGLSTEETNQAIWHQLGHKLFDVDTNDEAEQPSERRDPRSALLAQIVEAELEDIYYETSAMRRNVFEMQNRFTQLVVDKNL